MNPTEAKFHDDLDTIASQLDLDVQSGKYTWKDVQERLKDKTTQLASATGEYLHEYTWTAVALAAGFGVLLGLLVPRR
jgi:ElaB/YqjD/DUF883 family membrane-anchored ribosome-binding protein